MTSPRPVQPDASLSAQRSDRRQGALQRQRRSANWPTSSSPTATKLPEVTHLLIDRPFGYKSLMVPWDKSNSSIPTARRALAIDGLEAFEGEPADGQICLRDHLLDKKVLDCDDDEVEVVYDIKLTAQNGQLYVTDVDCSRAGFLRRIGLQAAGQFHPQHRRQDQRRHHSLGLGAAAAARHRQLRRQCEAERAEGEAARDPSGRPGRHPRGARPGAPHGDLQRSSKPSTRPIRWRRSNRGCSANWFRR